MVFSANETDHHDITEILLTSGVKILARFVKCVKMKQTHRSTRNLNFKFHAKKVLISIKSMNRNKELIIYMLSYDN
jgi:hypothetical protein